MPRRVTTACASSRNRYSRPIGASFGGAAAVATRRELRAAAAAGDVGAMTELGVLLDQEGHTPEAEKWLRRAAGAGDVAAMNNLGVLLRQSDRSGEAEQWYERAVSAGNANATFNLGLLHKQSG